ncbi:hypothetical protein, partial [Cryobacterium sp. TMT2-23]
MKVKLGLRRGDGIGDAEGTAVDIVVTADATAKVSDVARAIAEADPDHGFRPTADDALTLQVAPPEATAYVDLDADSPIGETAVGSGFNARVVRAAAPGGARSSAR